MYFVHTLHSSGAAHLRSWWNWIELNGNRIGRLYWRIFRAMRFRHGLIRTAAPAWFSLSVIVLSDATSITSLRAPAASLIPVFVYYFHLSISCGGPSSTSCHACPRSITRQQHAQRVVPHWVSSHVPIPGKGHSRWKLHSNQSSLQEKTCAQSHKFTRT